MQLISFGNALNESVAWPFPHFKPLPKKYFQRRKKLFKLPSLSKATAPPAFYAINPP
jgi:hypothetical protein